MNRFKRYGLIISAILIAFIIFQNTETVNTKFLFFSVSMPRALLLFLTALIGFSAGMLFAFRTKKQNSAPPEK